MNFVHIAEFDWLPGRHKASIFVKYSQIFSITIRGIKLILCIHDIVIILYIICDFCLDYMRSLVAMAA